MAKAAANGPDGGDAPAPVVETPRCGIVMPISAIDDCSAAHWEEVLGIVQAAADMAGFDARLVSAADYAGIILKQIIQNLYDDPIVVCDVSARNPNVMFELGLRLAFDKPTILIKDDKTNYAFDTSPIEHLDYPRDLRFGKIVEFKEKLADKIRATHQHATTDKNYTTFLKHFGTFKVATVDVKEVSGQEFILEEIKEIKSLLRNMRIRDRTNVSRNVPQPLVTIEINRDVIEVEGLSQSSADQFMDSLDIEGVKHASYDNSTNRLVITMRTTGDAGFAKLVNAVTAIASNLSPSPVIRVLDRS